MSFQVKSIKKMTGYESKVVKERFIEDNTWKENAKEREKEKWKKHQLI